MPEENNTESETELQYVAEPGVQAEEKLVDQETSSASSDENENSSTSESYWSAQDQIQSPMAEGPQLGAEQSSPLSEEDFWLDVENSPNADSKLHENLNFVTNQQNKESRSPSLETKLLPEAIKSQRSSSASVELTRELEQPLSVIANEGENYESSADLHISINLEDLEVAGTTLLSPVKRTKPKSIVSYPVRKNWLVADENNLPWWERLSRPRIYKPTPFYIPPFKATPYIFDPSTPRRTKKPDAEKEPEKFILQMSDRSRKIMRKKRRTGDWWYRLSRPKMLPRQ